MSITRVKKELIDSTDATNIRAAIGDVNIAGDTMTGLVFHRDNDLVETARAALGLTNEQLDTLWLQAATL